MYKEIVKPVGKTVIFVIAIIGGALLLAGIADALIVYLGLPFRSLIQLILLMVIAAGVYILVRNIVSEYSYSIIDDELIITSKLGDNERIIARIYMDCIEFIAFHTSPSLNHLKCDGRYNAKKSVATTRTYICVFNQDNKRYTLKFEPTDKLLELLGERGIKIER